MLPATAGARRLRSKMLLPGGTSGHSTNTNSSLTNFLMHLVSLLCGVDSSSAQCHLPCPALKVLSAPYTPPHIRARSSPCPGMQRPDEAGPQPHRPVIGMVAPHMAYASRQVPQFRCFSPGTWPQAVRRPGIRSLCAAPATRRHCVATRRPRPADQVPAP